MSSVADQIPGGVFPTLPPSPRSPAAMHESHSGVPLPPFSPQFSRLGNTFSGSGLIRDGLSAYGEQLLGSSSLYVQSNVSRYFSNVQYYFQINDQYVRNKLKVLLFPFFHRGHWTRICEPVGGRLSYKPPIYDINAPDLYIPLMAFGTYVFLAGFSTGLLGTFRPEVLSLQFIKGILGWFAQVMLLKAMLYTVGSHGAPLLDLVAYTGYAFTGLCLSICAGLVSTYAYYFVLPWMSICMGFFLVKTMRRILCAEVRSHGQNRHYFLLFVAVAQFPLIYWLGNVS